MSDDLNIDFDREKRLGFPEIVYGESKSVPQLQTAIDRFAAAGKPCLITRLQAEKAVELTGGEYDSLARTWKSGPYPNPTGPLIGIVSAGTSDAPVVLEAAHVLDLVGLPHTIVQDVGVAGLHRLLERLPDLEACAALIVAAGFEGALPSVLGGLVPQPIIAVPTSVGYGRSRHGKTALNAMLSSCANGITVVNIDNGCGAALAATRMLRVRLN